MSWFSAFLASIGIATSPAPVATSAAYPAGVLASIPATVQTGHPFLLTNPQRVAVLIKAAGSDPSASMELTRLATSVKQWVADPAMIAQLETPYSGNDLRQYQIQFSVVSGNGGGAALFALDFAFYHLIHSMDADFGTDAIDAAAADAARAIIWNWSQSGFRPGGKLLSSYNQFSMTEPAGAAVSNTDAWEGVNLQVGRGMFPLVVAQDMMEATTPADRNAAIKAFFVSMRDMLIGAANDHFTSSPYMDCHRYDNQADTGMTSLLALASYTGDTDLIRDMAGDPKAPKLLLWSWPQQVEAQIYGTGESARTCNNPTTTSDKYNPVAVLGEITDRERNDPYKPFGYTQGSMNSLMQAGYMFHDLGYDAYHFTGPHGQGIQAALDYYSQYYVSYAAPGLVAIPATGSIPDFAQYAGDVYTTAAPGAAVMGGDGLIWPYVIGGAIYPDDTKIWAVLDKSQALYQAELTASGGKTVWLPHSNPDIVSLVVQGFGE